jgi:hypothetical protein
VITEPEGGNDAWGLAFAFGRQEVEAPVIVAEKRLGSKVAWVVRAVGDEYSAVP